MLTACTNCCGGSMAKAWCLDCVEALCQDCVAAHKRVKVTRCHRILNQRPEDFPKSDSAARAIFCSIHPKEVIQLYCFTCDLLTCRDCQLMDHRTHDFQFVCMAYQSIRKQMYRVLKPVDKHTETAMQSIQVMSSRLKDIHSNKAKLKLSFETLVKTFCLQFKQRLSQHYAQVVAIYKSEEEILRNTMQGLLEKVEEYTIRMRTIEDDTTDIKTLLARKAEMKRWSKWILSQEVSPPKSMTKATITINTTSWKAILSLGELQVSYVPFACNESNSPEVAGASAPTPAAASATTCTDSPPLPLTALPQTSNVGSSLQSSSDVGSSLQSSSDVGSSLQSSSNVGLSLQSSSNVGSSLQSSSDVGSSLQSSSNVGLSLQSSSNVGSSLQSSSNVGSSLQSSRNVGSSLQSFRNVGSSLQSSSNGGSSLHSSSEVGSSLHSSSYVGSTHHSSSYVGSSLQSSSNVGLSLQSSRNVGSSLQSSSNVGSSPQSSSNVGSSLQSSRNVGSSLQSSRNVGSSLQSSSNVGSSLHSSSNVGSSLQSSRNVGSSLQSSRNVGSSPQSSSNVGSSLQSSSNVGSSLQSSRNVGSSLQSSRNVGSSLQSSSNVGSSLQSSRNVGSSLQSSSNVGSSLQSSSNVGSSLQSSSNVGSSLQSSSNVGSSLQSFRNVGSSLQSSSDVGSSLQSSSDVGSSLQSSSDVGSSLQSSSDVGSSLQSSSNVGSRLKRINKIGSRLKRINNIELNVKRTSQSQKVTTTTQSPPTCNYQWYSHARSGHSGMNSDRSLVVQNAQPLPLKDSAECTPIGVQTSLAPVHPANHPSYRVLPTGTNFYPVIASSSIMKHTGSTTGGPNENFIMVGAPIVSSHPTLVLDQHSEPVNDIMQANPSSASLFHQNKAQSSLNPAAPKALPCPAVCYSSSYNRGTSHDVGVPAGHLTHNQILPVTNVPSPPSKQPHTPQDVAPSRAEEVMARNPLLYQIILKCLSSSGYTGNAGTSGPEHTQPIPASKDAPPSPQGPLPTTEIVKGLADSACDVSSNQGSEKGSQAPNIQENKLISTVSDTKLLQDIPSIVSERLTVWEDGGELSDTKDVKPPTYSGVQEAAPASPACPEPHLEAGCTQAAGALAEDPASPESPEEDLVDPEPLGEEPSEDDPAEVGGLASTEGPCNYSPVVSLFRLPLLSVAPGRPLPRIFIHAGDTDQEMYLEEKIEDDVSAASSMSEGLQLSAVLGVDADGSLLDPVSKGADQQPASAPGGDPGPGQDADQEEKAGPRRRRPKKRSKVAEKMKETRKRLRAFLETSSSLPTKKRAAHQGTMYMV